MIGCGGPFTCLQTGTTMEENQEDEMLNSLNSRSNSTSEGGGGRCDNSGGNNGVGGGYKSLKT